MVRRHGPVALLAVLAYLPAFLASPGRMPADSKLYLYLDPGGFFADAAATFDPGQFGGWVPHQHISYLWPAGPWYRLFDLVGLPDWIAHRLWIGTVLVAAGLGVRWCARKLGLGATAALTAALVYQVSLYVLPYVSRTSVMLLPWAGLGWIVGLTVRATHRRTWGDPAAIALVVLTVGSVNATALAMIVPAPVLWLVHEVWRRALPWRAAVVVAARVAVLSVGVSFWWVVALVVQGRYGADVLPFSESLADVSLTATSAEVWRGLGYWLFYLRDPYAATTTASLRYLVSTPAIVVSYVVPVACLLGLVWVRWPHRRFAALLIATGGVLAVGVHPIGDRSPLMRLLAGSDEGGLALALRSSTRAVPMLLLGLALAGASMVDSLPRLRPRLDRLATAAIGVVVLVNLPGLWTGAVVDPALERDQDPPKAWTAAVADLDSTTGRVLMVPGVEFGAYRWGYTVDQPLPGLTDVPVVTRDLLPLGSPAAMDLLYALDDRIQDGVLEPASVAPVARLLGVDTVWLTNDVAYDRFRTARPEVVRDLVAGSGDVTITAYGEPTENLPDVAMTDERSLADPRVGAAVPPVELAVLDRPGRVVRTHGAELRVAGSGDGLVDAAAAGLLHDGVAVRYTASLADDPSGSGNPEPVGYLVTDSNRDRARHWRGSQDTSGYTEPGGPGNGLLAEGAGDARLPVFGTDTASEQTTAVQVGPVRATATAYGEPFALLSEHRPVMAVDGDLSTWWSVGEHGDPVGETIRLTLESGRPTGLRLVQPPSGGRRITAVTVVERSVDGTELARRPVELAPDPDGAGVEVGLGADPALVVSVDITITGVGGGEPFTGSAVAGVGFAEIDLGVGPTVEVVRPPALVDPGDAPIAYVFTRLRVDPLDRWRDDPEPTLSRGWEQPRPATFVPRYTVRIDARATDAELAELFGWTVVADRRLTGSLRSVGLSAFDGDPSTAWVGPFGSTGGSLTVRGVTSPVATVTVDRPTTGFSTVTELTLTSGSTTHIVALDPSTERATVTLDPPLPPGEVTVSVSGADPVTTVDRRFGDPVVLPVAIREILLDGTPSLPGVGASTLAKQCEPVAALDGTALSATVGITGEGWLDGAPIVAEACGGPVALDAGSHRLDGLDTTLQLDRVVLDAGLDDAVRAAAERSGWTDAVEVVRRDRFGADVTTTCPEGCWLVFGEGVNEGWRATADGVDLGGPTMIDGGFNGWWIEPGRSEVAVRWAPQRLQTLALVLSAIVTLVAVVLVVRDRRRPATAVAAVTVTPVWSWDRPVRTGPVWVVPIAWAVPALLLAGPIWGAVALVGGVVAHRLRTVPIAALTALVTVGVIGLAVAYVERRDAPLPSGGWPSAFEGLHAFGMLAFGLLVTSALTERD